MTNPANLADEAALDKIVAHSNALATARAELDQAVGEARQARISWAEIGKALGVSRQAVWERFRHVEPAQAS